MKVAGDILWWILLAYLLLIIARAVIGWLPVRWPKGIRPLILLIHDITEPFLSLLRRFIPIIPVSGGVGLDLSPMAAIILILFLQWLVKTIF